MMEEKRMQEAREAFEKRNHKAKLIENGERYTAIDWRMENGSGDYYINYIIDKKRGSLIISGDLGDCIATWFNRNSVHNIAQYINSVDYFISKFQCTSDDYTCDEDEVIEDIQEDLDDNREYWTEEEQEDFDEEWEDFKYGISDSIFDNCFHPDRDQQSFLEKYLGDDWWDGGCDWGQRISQRVYLWIAGLQMAVKQLTEEELLMEED